MVSSQTYHGSMIPVEHEHHEHGRWWEPHGIRFFKADGSLCCGLPQSVSTYENHLTDSVPLWWEFLAEIPRNVIIWNVRGSGFQYPQSIWVLHMSILWIWNDLDPWMFLILMMFGCLALWEIAGMESHLIAVLCCAMLCFDSGFGWPRPFSRSSGSNRSKQRSGWIRVDWGRLAPICAEAWWEPDPKYIPHHVAWYRIISYRSYRYSWAVLM